MNYLSIPSPLHTQSYGVLPFFTQIQPTPYAVLWSALLPRDKSTSHT